MKKLLNEWRGYLNESSFGRVKRKIDEGRIPFALVSAYREDGNNQTAHKSIKSDLVSMGYSFTEVVGGGQEELKDEEGQTIEDEEGTYEEAKAMLESFTSKGDNSFTLPMVHLRYSVNNIHIYI